MTPLLLTTLLACSPKSTSTDDSGASTDASGCPAGMVVATSATLTFSKLNIDAVDNVVDFDPTEVFDDGTSSSCIDTRTGGRAQLTFALNKKPFGTVYVEVGTPGSFALSDTTNSFRIALVNPPVQYDNGPAEWASGTWTAKLSPLEFQVTADAASKSHNVDFQLDATVPRP